MSSVESHVYETVREGDRARYLAALLAPSSVRGDLMSLYAFDLEISAIPDRVVEPLAGEIRLQWWRDVLESTTRPGTERRENSGNPVADSVSQLINSGQLDSTDLIPYLDAHSHLFHEDPVPDQAALERVFKATHGAILAMSCKLMMKDIDSRLNEVIDASARATGYAMLVLGFGKNASKQRVFVPPETLTKYQIDKAEICRGETNDAMIAMLDEVREKARDAFSVAASHIRQLEPQTMPVFAHLCGLRKALAVSEKMKQTPFMSLSDLNPLILQWCVWRAVRSKKI